tara:strand:- start:277 stop:765 length:489 start_codon:yes stop_codon:yes gene_type:complete
MKISLQLNLQQRQAQIQRLELTSEYLGTFLVRSETLLKRGRYHRALCLIDTEDADGYYSILDYLLATVAPEWAESIQEFYDDEGPKLGELADYWTIDEMDRGIAKAITGLATAHRIIEEEVWADSRRAPYPPPSKFMKRLTLDRIRAAATIPPPPRKRRIAA